MNSTCKLEFKTVRTQDIPTLKEMIKKLYEHESITYLEKETHEALTALLNNAGLGKAWLIHSDTKTAGYLILVFGFSVEFNGKVAYIDELYIKPEFRQKGIGKKAVEFAEAECKSLGIKALRLEVETNNTKAQSVYRKSGFKEHERYIMTKGIL